MFKPWQVILFLLIVVLSVVGFIFWYYATPGMGTAPTTADAVPTQQVAPAPAAPDPATITTDAQIEADLSGIDTLIQAADDQAAAVDQSLNDKPVAQTE